MTRDYTFSKYRELCEALLCSGYNTITVQDYIQGQAVEPFVILRHDMDRRLEMAGMKRIGEIFDNQAEVGDSRI